MKKLKLTQNRYTMVDNEDFDWLNQWKWQYDSHGYATRRMYIQGGKGKSKKIYMHKFITRSKNPMKTDHINRNKLDNRKENLRVVTHSKNLLNRGKNSNNTSGYKGVFFDKLRNKWIALIKVNYKSIYLGRFSDIKNAALAYKKAEGAIL